MFAHSRGWLRRMEEDIAAGLSAEAAVEKEQSTARSRLEQVGDAYLRERLAVPVINPGPLSYKLAEAALALRLSHSRKAHPRPAVSRLDMVDAMLAAAVAPPRDGS